MDALQWLFAVDHIMYSSEHAQFPTEIVLKFLV